MLLVSSLNMKKKHVGLFLLASTERSARRAQPRNNPHTRGENPPCPYTQKKRKDILHHTPHTTHTPSHLTIAPLYLLHTKNKYENTQPNQGVCIYRGSIPATYKYYGIPRPAAQRPSISIREYYYITSTITTSSLLFPIAFF